MFLGETGRLSEGGIVQPAEFLSARLQSVTLLEKENIDWEDIAVAVEDGISYIYVADTGNNHESRGIIETSY